jgi:IPT/TIG domain-containing protein
MTTTTVSRLSIAMTVAAFAVLTGCDGGRLDPVTGRFEPAPAAASRAAEPAPGWMAAPAPSADMQPGAYVNAYGQAQLAPPSQPDPEAFSHTYSPPAAPAAPAAAAPAASPDTTNTARTPPVASGLRPNIARVSPSRGEPGAELTIVGSDFANVQVIIGGQVAQVTSQSSNAVTVIAPEGHSGPVAVVVTNRDGSYSVAGSAYQYM